MYTWLPNPHRFIFLPTAMLGVVSTVMKPSRYPNWLHRQYRGHKSLLTKKRKCEVCEQASRCDGKASVIVFSYNIWSGRSARVGNILRMLAILNNRIKSWAWILTGPHVKTLRSVIYEFLFGPREREQVRNWRDLKSKRAWVCWASYCSTVNCEG